MNKKRQWYDVSKQKRIALAGGVWCLAGVNVTRLGFNAYKELAIICWYYPILSCIVFLPFAWMFSNMSRKRAEGIWQEAQIYRPLWTFFDGKSYIIMIAMMSFGIGLRQWHLVPQSFIATFYTGLGIALVLGGVVSFFVKKPK